MSQTLVDQSRLLSVKEVCEILGIKRASLFKYYVTPKNENSIPVYKLSGKYKFKYDELMFWIDNQKI